MSAFRTTCVCATGAYRAVAATGDVTQDAMPAMALRIAANLKAERGPGPRDDGWRASKSSRATVWQSAQPLVGCSCSTRTGSMELRQVSGRHAVARDRRSALTDAAARRCRP
ncbi:hypothetical protein XcvCFBP7111P_00455 [Xanthomonas citri pv. vignicola]|uniref:Uncharacterized protein n=1 Tax=Xanthomonas citri pv. vignicola TaxID=473426 RepID=A0AB33CHL0_XANCI|nr:hypothetical protein XcvCFBP7111P_00455 [Xanthomonas citri pv. vignicola]